MTLDRVVRPETLQSWLEALRRRVSALETAPGFAAGTSRGGTTHWQDATGVEAVTIGLLLDGTYGIQSTKFIASTTSTATDMTLTGGLIADHATIGSAGVGTSGLTVGPLGDKVLQVRLYTPTLTPVALAASLGGQEQSFTVNGLTVNDTVIVNPPGQTANCPMVAARISAINTLRLTFANFTAAANVPTAGAYRILAVQN